MQEGGNSVDVDRAKGDEEEGLPPSTAVPAAAPRAESAVQKQLGRDKLRAQRLAELQANGSSDDDQ